MTDLLSRDKIETADGSLAGSSQEKMLSSLLENVTDIIALLNADGAIRYASPSVERLLGYKPEELLGQNGFALVHPDDLARAHEAFESVLLHPESAGPLVEVRSRHKNGSWRYTEVIGQSLADEFGQPCMVMSLRDITERKIVEEALRQSEHRLRLHFEQTHLGVIELDTDFKITRWNPAAEKIFCFTAAEAIGQDGRFFVPEDAKEQVSRIYHSLTSQTGGERSTNENITKDGRTILCDWHNTPLTDADGQLVGVVSMVEDVTERQRMEEQLLRSQRTESIGTLAGGIAHDLNNILCPILLSASMLREGEQSAEAIEMLDTLEENARRGADMVKQILTFSRGLKTKKGPVQTRYLLKDFAGLIRETFPKSITLKLGVAPELWPVHGNLTELHQILMNLCLNARDAMPDGGTLTITAENIVLDQESVGLIPNTRPGHYVAWLIADSGTGIAPEILDRIFDPFFTTKELGKGTGLGLSIVHGLIRSHNAAIRVQSKLGAGTEFRVYLPASSAPLPESEHSAPPPPVGVGEEILVVDDEEAICHLADKILTRQGYHVVTARNGEEAIKRYQRNRSKIQLVLTDIMMPGLDGWAVIRSIRNINPAVKIIASSGLMSETSLSTLSDLNVNAVLAKPYLAHSLLETIQTVLRTKS